MSTRPARLTLAGVLLLAAAAVPPGKHGQPQPPVTLGKNLLFPDGVTVVTSSRFAVNFRQLPPSPDFTPAECGGE
jgi:hypothetical protein